MSKARSGLFAAVCICAFSMTPLIARGLGRNPSTLAICGLWFVFISACIGIYKIKRAY